MVDQLAGEYASQPVFFLEQNVDASVGYRSSRWWAAFEGSSVTLPMAMVDSGNEITSGYENFHTVYSGMVDRSLARPALASISAFSYRVGDTVQVDITLTNNSGTILSSSNGARVHALVYEEAVVGLTGRFVHEAPSAWISPDLADGATMNVSLVSPALSGVDWNKLHVIVLADYRPAGSTGSYDTLQAAVAVSDLIFGDGFESSDTTAWSAAN